MPYTPILATLAYVLSPDGRQVLLIHRNRRPEDAHFGKYNGLGGKMDAGEDVVACLRREVREEAGLECERIVLRGTVSWPGFGKHGEDWFGFIFRIDRWSGQPSYPGMRRARWSGWRSNGCSICRSGKGTAFSCRWSLSGPSVSFTASCPTATAGR